MAIRWLTGFLFFVWFLTGCKKDDTDVKDDKGTANSEQVIATNEWMYEFMRYNYLWNDQIPAGLDITAENNPENFFNQLLYKEKDQWSVYIEDFQLIKKVFEGRPLSMGYFPVFYLQADMRSVFMVVSYVYPDSPADDVGLIRGDIIYSINGKTMNKDNYFELYSGAEYTVKLGKLTSKGVEASNHEYHMVAREIKADPVIQHKIIYADNGVKVGYMFYAEFISGVQNEFIHSIEKVLNYFKESGVKDLVLDLRYNLGGDLSVLQYLASNLVPEHVANNNKLFLTLQYNPWVQNQIEKDEGKAGYSYVFSKSDANLDLNRLFVLTTGTTASASESLIIGLEPYMNVVQIGETTYGKYVASWIVPDEEEEIAIMPIVSKMVNSNGFTDFENGLDPDHSVEDNLLDPYPLGSKNDPMVKMAINEINKTIGVHSLSMPEVPLYKKLEPAGLDYKRNLFLP
jgi:carboxyl-terminal processing protease